WHLPATLVMVYKHESLAVGIRYSDGVNRLACAAPLRAVLEHKLFAGSRDRILIREPGHIQHQKPTVRLQHPKQVWHHSSMVKVPKTLAGRDHIKAGVRETQVFGRNGVILNLHSF